MLMKVFLVVVFETELSLTLLNREIIGAMEIKEKTLPDIVVSWKANIQPPRRRQLDFWLHRHYPDHHLLLRGCTGPVERLHCRRLKIRYHVSGPVVSCCYK